MVILFSSYLSTPKSVIPDKNDVRNYTNLHHLIRGEYYQHTRDCLKIVCAQINKSLIEDDGVI